MCVKTMQCATIVNFVFLRKVHLTRCIHISHSGSVKNRRVYDVWQCLTIYWVEYSSKIRSLITYLHLFMHEKSKWWLLFSMLPWCLNVKCYKRLKYYFHHHQTSLTCLERELYCTLLSFPCPLHLNCLRCILGMSQVSGFYKMRFVFKPGFHLSYETFI